MDKVITITCWRWLHLFETGNAYDAVYKWFDYLKSKRHYITGYVIVPNHLHALIAFRHTQGVSINKIVGNGKRFMAYAIVSKLEELNKQDVLTDLSSYVNATEKQRNKLHEYLSLPLQFSQCLPPRGLCAFAHRLSSSHYPPIEGDLDEI